MSSALVDFAWYFLKAFTLSLFLVVALLFAYVAVDVLRSWLKARLRWR